MNGSYEHLQLHKSKDPDSAQYNKVK